MCISFAVKSDRFFDFIISDSVRICKHSEQEGAFSSGENFSGIRRKNRFLKKSKKISKNFQKSIDKGTSLWYNNHVLKRAGQNPQKEAPKIVQFAGVAQWQSS